MEGLKVSKANLVVYIHPSKSTKIYDAVLSELSTLLFTYNERFDGVVLAYGIDDIDETVKIMNGLHPFLRVKLVASLLLFSPKPDMLIEGKVAKITRGSIHLIIHGFASAVIEDPEIRNELEYKIKHGEGRYFSKLHKRHVLKVGSTVRFLVKSFDEDVLHIAGSLTPDRTGNLDWLAKFSEDDTVSHSSKAKRPIEHDSKFSDNAEHKTKKSKKSKRSREES